MSALSTDLLVCAHRHRHTPPPHRLIPRACWGLIWVTMLWIVSVIPVDLSTLGDWSTHGLDLSLGTYDDLKQ